MYITGDLGSAIVIKIHFLSHWVYIHSPWQHACQLWIKPKLIGYKTKFCRFISSIPLITEQDFRTQICESSLRHDSSVAYAGFFPSGFMQLPCWRVYIHYDFMWGSCPERYKIFTYALKPSQTCCHPTQVYNNSASETTCKLERP